MAKCKFIEKRSLSIEGLLDSTEMTIDVEDSGMKVLQEVFSRFDGEVVKIVIQKTEEF